VLITTAILLMTALQATFIQPPMVIRLTKSDRSGRADLVGGLYRDQRRIVPWFAVITAVMALVLWLRGRLDLRIAAILIAATLAIIATLYREFLRLVLFAYRRPNDVLRSDFVYCILLVAGAFAATLTPLPAATAALTMALSATICAPLLSRAVWRHEPWNTDAPRGTLLSIVPIGAWSVVGGVTHWLFSQGYNYVVAYRLDVAAVAALAATRLLVMPVNLLSTGIGSLMLPTVSRWMHDFRPATVMKRSAFFAVALAGLACCYLLLMWLLRDWIYSNVLRKHFANRDYLLLLWCVIAIVMVFRDQLLYFLVARTRFKSIATLTLISAVLAITTSFFAISNMGAAGALVGLLTGELFNVCGIVFLSIRELRLPPPESAEQ
jgi:O-antigen/teichoic acid export membrane protein